MTCCAIHNVETAPSVSVPLLSAPAIAHQASLDPTVLEDLMRYLTWLSPFGRWVEIIQELTPTEHS